MTLNFTMLVGYASRVFTNTSLVGDVKTDDRRGVASRPFFQGHRLLHRLDLTNLRHVFYLITPYETSVSTIEQVPNYNIQVRGTSPNAWWIVATCVTHA